MSKNRKIKKSPIHPFLEKQGFLILDGALATELEARGADLRHALWSAKILMEQPELIRLVHLDYFRAGADVATTASYQATVPGLCHYGLSRKEACRLLQISVELAQQAREDFITTNESHDRLTPLIAASIGPYGAYLADGSEYRGHYGKTVEQVVDFHRPRLEALLEAGPDLLAFETIPNRLEGEALLQLLADYPEVWAWISFSAKNGAQISEGQFFSDIVALVEDSPQIVAVGINCTAPRHIEPLLQVAVACTEKPLVVYPNSGEGWNAEQKCWLPTLAEKSLMEGAERWYSAGARLIGGCCRTRPADIQRLREKLVTELI